MKTWSQLSTAAQRELMRRMLLLQGRDPWEVLAAIDGSEEPVATPKLAAYMTAELPRRRGVARFGRHARRKWTHLRVRQHLRRLYSLGFVNKTRVGYHSSRIGQVALARFWQLYDGDKR